MGDVIKALTELRAIIAASKPSGGFTYEREQGFYIGQQDALLRLDRFLKTRRDAWRLEFPVFAGVDRAKPHSDRTIVTVMENGKITDVRELRKWRYPSDKHAGFFVWSAAGLDAALVECRRRWPDEDHIRSLQVHDEGVWAYAFDVFKEAT